ncbi:MAG: hypothetical protein PQJ35_07835 [Sphaerochaetaceae bacterium]|nr:hypothetical protein [Sphaerochaetaceae bacterium]
MAEGKQKHDAKASSQETSPKKRRRRSKQKKKMCAQKSQQETLQSGRKKRKRPPSSLQHPIIVPQVQEPVPLCALCGKPVQAISQAISGPGEGQFSHFDCVLRKIADEEKILPHQKVSYIGRGTFAVVDKDDEGNMVFVKQIVYETPETFSAMKKFVEEHKR